MSDEHKISRRASLRGIAATGAVISGTGLSAGTVSASDKKVDYIKKIDFKSCHSMAVYLKDGAKKIPIKIRAYNGEDERIENIHQTIKKNKLLPYKLWKKIHNGKKNGGYDVKNGGSYDDKKHKDLCTDHEKKNSHAQKYVWTFNIYQFYNHAIDAEDKILSVKVGNKRIKNTNECAKKYPHEYDKKGKLDTDDIYLKPICVNSEYNTVRYRVDNWNKKPVTVSYDAYNTNYGGKVHVEPHSVTYFGVKTPAPTGSGEVGLYLDGEQIDVVKPNGRLPESLAKEKIAFNINDVDYSERKVELYVHDGTDFDRTFHYYDYKSGAAGTITVHDEPGSAETFWLPAPHCGTSVELFYQGHVVGKAER